MEEIADGFLQSGDDLFFGAGDSFCVNRGRHPETVMRVADESGIPFHIWTEGLKTQLALLGHSSRTPE